MSKRTDEKYLDDIRRFGREAIALAADMSAEQFERDRKLQFALAYAVQVVGEAAYQLSDAARASIPDIPWPKIIGMRHRLVHGYGDVVYDIVLEVARRDLPNLIAALEKFTPPEPPSA